MTDEEMDGFEELTHRASAMATEMELARSESRRGAERRPPLSYEETANCLLQACAEIMSVHLERFIVQTDSLIAENPGPLGRLWTLRDLARAAQGFRTAGVQAAKAITEVRENPEAALRKAE